MFHIDPQMAPQLMTPLRGLTEGKVIPYLGPGVLDLEPSAVPAGQTALASFLTSKTSVPFKLRGNLPGSAQYVENFKHRKTLTRLMVDAFSAPTEPTVLHRQIAKLAACPMIVDVWYDQAAHIAMASRSNWGQIQGVSRADHPGRWYRCLHADGAIADDDEPADWDTVLYKPLGSVMPEGNFAVSDSDFVEILTEIDIQTPIPPAVCERRAGRHFLFLGCRFNTQLDRIFARQIMKRSSAPHWAVLPQEPTRNELRFLDEQQIERIEMPLADFAAALERFGREEAAASN
jgi:hypothetical protein